jgi:peptidyl-prolyl cis-trans isomerase D
VDEIRDDLVQRWTGEQVRAGLIAKANELLDKLKAGETFEAVAASAGLEIRTSPTLKRGQPAEGLSTSVIAAAFAGGEGHVATAPGDGDSRVVLQVKDITEPAFFGETEATRTQSKQIADDIQNTILEQYAHQLRTDIGITINQAQLTRLVGNNPNQP